MSKILVVDDELNICELLKLYLENEGYTVFTANDGQVCRDRLPAEGTGFGTAGHYVAQDGRLAGVPRDPQDLFRPHHHAHRQGRDL